MAFTEYTLRDAAGTLLLDLNDQNAVFTDTCDLGFAVTRAVTFNRTGADGTIDPTGFHGGRAITWHAYLNDTNPAAASAFVSALQGLCHPAQRIYLHTSDPGWAQNRRILIRRDQGSVPRVAARECQVSWVGIDGVLEDVNLSQAVIPSGATGDGVVITASTVITADTVITGVTPQGISFPLSFPASFGAAESSATVQIVNAGNTVVPPLIRIPGPCTNPTVLCATTGLSMSFPNFTVPAGQFILVDCLERTASLNGDLSSRVAPDPVSSDWLFLPASPLGGMESQWQLKADSFGDGFEALLEWRSRWI